MAAVGEELGEPDGAADGDAAGEGDAARVAVAVGVAVAVEGNADVALEHDATASASSRTIAYLTQ